MNNTISIRTKITKTDYRSLVFFNTYLKRRSLLVLLAFAALISLSVIIGRLAGLIPVSLLGRRSVIPIPDWHFYACIAFLGLLLLQYLVFEFSVRRFLATDQLATENERTVVISDSGINTEGGKENSTAAYRWDMFFLSYETKKYFYLYINNVQAVILPKKDFSEAEIPIVRDTLKEKLGKRFHKR